MLNKKIMFLFLLITYIIFPFKHYAEQMTVMTEEWPPYNYTKSNKLTGFSTEIVRAIMKRLGVDYKIHVYPGARGELYAKTKPNHLLFSIFRTPARESLYKWIGPLASENIYFFKMKDKNIKATTFDEIINMNYTVMANHEGFVLNSLINKGIVNIDKSASSTEKKLRC
ncbi:substrate-binding periplasmic protein [Piscirickettsia salmonis]|uniref:substrate-binding periplasmic protein n=1 Tax=Piscirickettsia salmonis TaxID=1238 RepID=UPI0007C8EDD9|nr:Bacterial extracellular solute-binding protein, family 3 [Piscirickettsiaceae bacterium NZ-RLO1]